MHQDSPVERIQQGSADLCFKKSMGSTKSERTLFFELFWKIIDINCLIGCNVSHDQLKVRWLLWLMGDFLKSSVEDFVLVSFLTKRFTSKPFDELYPLVSASAFGLAEGHQDLNTLKLQERHRTPSSSFSSVACR